MHELFQPPIWHTLDLQNYTNVVVGEHGIQISKVMIVVLFLLLFSFDVFIPTSASSLLFMAKWLVQMYLNVSYV